MKKNKFKNLLALSCLMALVPIANASFIDDATVSGDTVTYQFNSAADTYELTENMINMSDGQTLNILGVNEGEEYSTFDLNWNSGINANWVNTEINISNTAFMNGSAYNGSALSIDSGSARVITQITNSEFQNNYAKSLGGAIYNAGGDILQITGAFIQNTVGDCYVNGAGGAIFNHYAEIPVSEEAYPYVMLPGINSIDAEFIGNIAQGIGNNGGVAGGAIANDYYIGEIKGSFIENIVKVAPQQENIQLADTNYTNGYGGAIYNNGGIDSIQADFTDNYISSEFDYSLGGAIYNSGEIGSIEGNFSGNLIESQISAFGGAIFNSEHSAINNITGLFDNNSVTSYYERSTGGAIANAGNIDSINGDFTNNCTTSEQGMTYGGAIANENASIEKITGDFTNNRASASNSSGGGAIENYEANIHNIIGNFTNNYAHSEYSNSSGGAILNADSAIFDITGDFSDNYVISLGDGSDALGGAITNEGYIGNITGNFSNNYAIAQGDDGYASGGAIYNDLSIDLISGIFKNNYASASAVAAGGAIFNQSAPAEITLEKNIDFNVTNVTDDTGNIVLTISALKDGANINKYITLLKDGVNALPTISSTNSSTLSSTLSAFNVDNIEDLKTVLLNDGYALSTPEQLYSENYISSGSDIIDAIRTTDALTFKNSSFIGNHVDVPEGGTAAGGAIYSSGNIRMIADNGQTSLISGNYTKIGEVINDTAITMVGNSILTFDTRNNSTIQIDDKIEFLTPEPSVPGSVTPAQDTSSINRSALYLIGDKTGKTVINNDIINADEIFLEQANIYLGRDDVFNQSNSIALGNGFLSMANGAVGQIHLPKVGFFGETNVAVDVDLATETMDRITGDEYVVIDGAKINVTELNLLSDATKDSVKILFADEEFAPIVDYTGENPVAYSPIYKYNIGYEVDNDDNKGYFLFDRYGVPTGGNGGNGGPSIAPSNPSQIYNPSVLATPAAQQSGGQAVMTETIRFAFQHTDTFTQMPMSVRMSMMNNRYAVLDGEAKYTRPNHMQNKGFWVKPFTSFESMDLKNGPKVDAITYGTIIGFDSNFQDFGKGWYGVTSGYVGYNGSLIDYQSVDTTMNGGIVGLTETMYKGKFFTALTATAGASAGSSNTMYGHENFAMLLGGIGSKTGYNFEFQEGKYIIQPIMFLNYTFVNTFDYTNAAGVNMESDPMHSLQLNPSVRFIANFKNGWQPYASVGMVWNVLNSSKVRANDILLPRMSVKPYVEYGLGLQRTWADRFTAYGQAMVRNGGRNGVMLSAGMRWSLGEDEPIDAI